MSVDIQDENNELQLIDNSGLGEVMEDQTIVETEHEIVEQSQQTTTIDSKEESKSCPSSSPSSSSQSSPSSSQNLIPKLDDIVSTFKVNHETYLSLAARVKVPSGWCWSFCKMEKVIYITNYRSIVADGSILIRTVRIKEDQSLSYHFHGNLVSPIGLSHNFSSYEHLAQLVTAFADTSPCGTITQCSLIDLANSPSSRLPYRLNEHGHVVSLNCQLVAHKGRQCVKCRNLRDNLMKRKRSSDIRAKKFNITSKQRMNTKELKLYSYQRKVRSLEQKAKTTCTLIKELRRDYRLLVSEARSTEYGRKRIKHR